MNEFFHHHHITISIKRAQREIHHFQSRLRISSLTEKEKRASLREKGADLLVLFVVVGYTKERVILIRIINIPKRNDGLDGSAKVSAKVAIFFVWTSDKNKKLSLVFYYIRGCQILRSLSATRGW